MMLHVHLYVLVGIMMFRIKTLGPILIPIQVLDNYTFQTVNAGMSGTVGIQLTALQLTETSSYRTFCLLTECHLVTRQKGC